MVLLFLSRVEFIPSVDSLSLKRWFFFFPWSNSKDHRRRIGWWCLVFGVWVRFSFFSRDVVDVSDIFNLVFSGHQNLNIGRSCLDIVCLPSVVTDVWQCVVLLLVSDQRHLVNSRVSVTGRLRALSPHLSITGSSIKPGFGMRTTTITHRWSKSS